MEWSYHHDDEGIHDYPEILPFDTRMFDYWTSGDIRIGYYGRGKRMTLFTYKDKSVVVRFSIVRGFGDGTMIPGQEYSGPVCSLYINDDLREKMPKATIVEIHNTISDFLKIYRNPRYPEEPLIESVETPGMAAYIGRNALRKS